MTTINVHSADPEAQRAAILSNAVFLQLVSATPAQIDAYLLAQVTTVGSARPVLSILAQAVAYLMNRTQA